MHLAIPAFLAVKSSSARSLASTPAQPAYVTSDVRMGVVGIGKGLFELGSCHRFLAAFSGGGAGATVLLDPGHGVEVVRRPIGQGLLQFRPQRVG